VITTSITVGGE
jgi:hypothetical protein